jgi:uncharacterized protein
MLPVSERRGIAVFFIVVLGIWTLMHGYAIGRVWGLPAIASPGAHAALLAGAALLWAAYPAGRVLARGGHPKGAFVLEAVGGAWMAILFLLIVMLLVADLATGFGLWAPRLSAPLRTAAIVAAATLALIALVQGARTPAVRERAVELPGLPAELDGLRLVHLSDLHVGTLLGADWFTGIARQVATLHPDLVVVTGDLVDGDVGAVERLVPELRRLQAPLGVWAVTGNHEFYAGLDRSVAALRSAGYRVIRDGWSEAAPGLVLAGVDDLTARRQFGLDGDPLRAALADRPAGATILLCHSPWQVEDAAAAGVALMLSGHTHGGQIWPFGYLVKLTYPHLEGWYRVGSMDLLVSRGTGTWGPRMRLWHPAEIHVLTLRASEH